MDNVGHGDVRDFNNKEKCSKYWQLNHEDYFKSMNSYDTSNIAEFCQRHELIKLIDVANPLTVKITCKFTSKERETKRPLYSTPYSYYNKDDAGAREASGFIFDIKEVHGGDYILKIATAMHVVFDEDEAWYTSCYLYYDGEDSYPVDLVGNPENVETDINNDWCVFEGTLDANKGKKVKENFDKYQKEKEILKRNAFARDRDKKVLLISHPHGCYKYLSMGDLITEKSFLSYTTPSCDGSSGGYLILVGVSTTSMFIHSGYFDKDKNEDGYSSGKLELN